ncbi:NUDIX hydrolase [Listeria marthii]|uniref:NUDIX hydrolase n=1 Tax=Listeria marthii TaxID=529731 RepID=UPI001625C0DB|nr:NUDIX hydrolase [Listeria marthii]MBC2101109.1 NUDIX hydrolase [Listeria marthii]
MKHVRTAAIITHQNKILLHSNQGGNYWTLPGGAVENEFTKDGLKREMKEELGEEVSIGDLKIVAENRFLYRGEEVDSIEFYYCVNLWPDSELPEVATFTKTEAFGQNEEMPYELNFKWIELDKLDEITILPPFLGVELKQLAGKTIKHIEQTT